MAYDELVSLGYTLGTGAVIVLNKDVGLFKAFARLSALYKHESCGQCEPCSDGTAKLAITAKIADGTGRPGDLEELEETAIETINCICAPAGAESDPIKGLLKQFRCTGKAKIVESRSARLLRSHRFELFEKGGWALCVRLSMLHPSQFSNAIEHNRRRTFNIDNPPDLLLVISRVSMWR
jgi:hypothetical protein